MRVLTCIVLCFTLGGTLLAGCGGEEDDTAGGGNGADNGGGNGGDNGGETGDSEPPPWEPTSGTYDLLPGEVLSDTCHFPDDGSGGGDTGLTSATQMNVEVAADRQTITITIPDAEGGAPTVTTCPRSDYSFHCDVADVVDSETAGQYGMDATFTITVDQDGTWANETHVDGVYTYGVDCRGGDCDTVTQILQWKVHFPCTGQVAYVADHA